jgi:hypothetical protein
MANGMNRFWLALALLCGLGCPLVLQGQETGGQPGLPPPPGLTPLPATESFVPPLNALVEPPPQPLTNAFSGGTAPCDHSTAYFSLGTQALRREGLRRTTVSVLDPGVSTTTQQTANIVVNGQDGQPGSEPIGEANPRTVTIPGTVNVTEATFKDTGNLPPEGSPDFGDFNQVDPRLAWGYKATLGYRIGDSAVEALGYYIPEYHVTSLVSSRSLPAANPASVSIVSLNGADLNAIFDPDRDGDAFVSSETAPSIQGPAANRNRLDLPFFNEPKGFKGIFLQADSATLTFQTAVGNGEVNYIYGGVTSEVALLAGFRYVDIQEGFSVLVLDDPVSPPDKVALYQTRTHNHLLLPQLGLEWRKELVPTFTVSATAKGAWGVNLIDTNVLLERGDGLIGFQGGRHPQSFSHLYELDFLADWAVTPIIHLRGGYTAFWVLGVAEASRQVDFDLSHTNGSVQNNGHILYHGPTVEVLFTF